jgi:hypothetical protein
VTSDAKPAASPVAAVIADQKRTMRMSARRAPNLSASHPLGISKSA